MKTRTLATLICLSTLIVFSNISASAQEGFLNILYGTPEDASRYANSYFAPIFKGLGYGFNNGWYNTAKTHKPLGVDFTISANLAYVPGGDEYFTFRNEDYEIMRVENGVEASTPTFFGLEENGPTINIPFDTMGQTLILASFNGPQGAGLKDRIGFNAVPSPILQLGIGAYKNTDIKIRYVPNISSNEFDYSVWGVGVMHDIAQWIPGLKKVPIDISIFGAYSSLSTNIQFDMDENFPGENQEISSKIKGYTIEAIVSKKISVITFFGAVGYNKATTSFNLLGTYDVTYNYIPEPITFSDPIKLKTDESSMRFTGGLRLHLAVVTLHGMYTFNGYNLLNVGLGFTFR